MRALVIIVSTLGVAGCDSAPPGQSKASPPALRVEYAGCRTVLEGPVCVLRPERTLQLWVATPDARLRIGESELEGAPVLQARTQGGQRFEVVLREGQTALTVRADAAGGNNTWALALGATSAPDLVTRATSAVDVYDLDNGEQLAREGLTSLPSEWHGRLFGLLGRIAFFRGDAQTAHGYLRKTIAADRRHGALFDETRDSVMLVHSLLTERAFTEARDRLEALPEHWGGPAEAGYLLSYYRGFLAFYTGDARSALRYFTAAAEQAGRLGLDELRGSAEQMLAEQYQKVGQRREAERLLSALRDAAPENLHACQRGQLLNNLAWSELLTLEAGELTADPTPLLQQALALFTEACAQLVDERVNVLLNLSLARLHAGELNEARRYLQRARTDRTEPQLRMVLWWRDIEARIALAAGELDDALRLYAALEQLAATSLSPETSWRALVGKALALQQLDELDAAVETFAMADAVLGEESLQVPVNDGRETFLAHRQWATRQHLLLLLDSGRPEEAFDVARRARSRAVRGLQRQERLSRLSPDERQRWDSAMAVFQTEREALAVSAAGDWRLPADELQRLAEDRATKKRDLEQVLDDAFAVLDRHTGDAPLPAGLGEDETELLYHPLPEGWIGFAHVGNTIVARTLNCDVAGTSDVELSRCLLSPFSAQIKKARQLRILPYGELRNVDFHALPFEGDVLLSGRPVIYGLDIGALPAGAEPEMPTALVVADPRGDLPAAREELTTVRTSLEQDGDWRIRTLEGAAVDMARLRRELPDVDLFHYAGHAVFAGGGGWDSALPLAEPGNFTVGDILALAGAPRWVVLSGCETGRTSHDDAPESLGLAHAFLASGSRAVLAAARPVADTTAAAFVRSFYESWNGGESAVAALQRAQLTLKRDDPGADWSSFRLVVP